MLMYLTVYLQLLKKMDWLEKSNNNHTISDLPTRSSDNDRHNKIQELINKVNDLMALIVSENTRL